MKWIPFIDTEYVLNLEDDLFVRRIAQECLLSIVSRFDNKIAGPFAPPVDDDNNYLVVDLHGSSKYSMILAIIFSYQNHLFTRIHCTKIVLHDHMLIHKKHILKRFFSI